MLHLILPPEIAEEITIALQRSGEREIGGVLMGEHVGHNQFRVTEITVHRRGGYSNFIRRIEDALMKLKTFFQQNGHDYTHFNYIGEWHSHPLFAPYPSPTDDSSMLEIVMDKSVGANFSVLLIVKLDLDGQLFGTAHTYLPDGTKLYSRLTII